MEQNSLDIIATGFHAFAMREERLQHDGIFWMRDAFIDEGWGEQLGVAAIAVFLVISRYANRDGLAWPGTAKICKGSGTTKPTVLKAIKRLEELGFIDVLRGVRGAAGRQASNHYQILPMSNWGRAGPSVKKLDSGTCGQADTRVKNFDSGQGKEFDVTRVKNLYPKEYSGVKEILKPPNPAERGDNLSTGSGDKRFDGRNPRAMGTNPRAMAAQIHIDKKKEMEAAVSACGKCQDGWISTENGMAQCSCVMEIMNSHAL